MEQKKYCEYLLNIHKNVLNELAMELFGEDIGNLYTKYMSIDIFGMDENGFCINGRFDEDTEYLVKKIVLKNGYTYSLYDFEYCLYSRITKM